MSSRPFTLTNTIHLRDFVDNIIGDPAKPNNSNYIEIHTEVNVFEEDGFHSSDVDVRPIFTRIRAYVTQDKRELYVPNSFVYVDGRFSTSTTSDNILDITIHALSV